MVLIIGYGMWKKIPVFDCFLDGARDGLGSAVQILPALIALITAVGMLKASGMLDFLIALISIVISITSLLLYYL